jgi:hypothetical protein
MCNESGSVLIRLGAPSYKFLKGHLQYHLQLLKRRFLFARWKPMTKIGDLMI